MPGRQSGEQAEAIPTPAAPRPCDARQQANHYHAAAAAERRRANHHQADLYLVAAAELEHGRRSGPTRRPRTDPATTEYRVEDVMNHQNPIAVPARRERRRLHGLLTRLARYAAQNLEPSRRYRRGW